MVAVAVSNTGNLTFRIQWRLKGNNVTDTATYCADSIRELARMLYKAEGVSQQTVDHIYIHQISREGAAFELVAVDGGDAPNINPHLLWDEGEADDVPWDYSKLPVPVTPSPLPQVTSNPVTIRFRAEQEPDDTLIVEGIFYGARRAPNSSTRYLEEAQPGGSVL